MTTKNLSLKIVAAGIVLGGVVLIASSAVSRAAGGEISAARGKYLVETMGCMDCHTPLVMGPKGPERDMAHWLAGHPEELVMTPAPKVASPWGIVASETMTSWNGPWGTSFTANLTPDEETGLGTWTADQFVETIRTQRHQGRGRALLPPMPASIYANLRDEDLRSIFAYLQSIPAVKNRVPQPLPPAEAN